MNLTNLNFTTPSRPIAPAPRGKNVFCAFFLALALSCIGLQDSDAQTIRPGPTGIMDLTPVDVTPEALAADPGWTNPNVKGFSVRMTWRTVEPSEGQFDFSTFDEAFALAAAHNKTLGLSLAAGSMSPSWIYTAGAQQFSYTTYGGLTGVMPLSWDPVFQKAWNTMITALGNRYASNPALSYVMVGGIGRDFESTQLLTAGNTAKFNALGGLTLWTPAASKIAKFFTSSFPNTHIICAMNPPTTGPGLMMMTLFVNGMLDAYPHQFGVACDSLSPVTQNVTTSVAYIEGESQDTTCGFQMSSPSTGLTGTLAAALQVGVGFKAQYIEVYSSDCALSSEQPALVEANTGLATNRETTDDPNIGGEPAGTDTMKAGPEGVASLMDPNEYLPSNPCWTNPNVKIVALRSHWRLIEASQGVFNWSYFDQAVALAKQHGKKISMSVDAGIDSPAWIYTTGSAKFTFADQAMVSSAARTTSGKNAVTITGGTNGIVSGMTVSGVGIPANTSATIAGATATLSKPATVTTSQTLNFAAAPVESVMPLPWDPAFQKQWQTFVTAFGARYDSVPELCYVVMGGMGRQAETYFVNSPADTTAFENAGDGPRWQAAGVTIAGFYAQAFPTTHLISALGTPTRDAYGTALHNALLAQWSALYPGRLGVSCDSLSGGVGPQNDVALIVEQFAPTANSGFQMLDPYSVASPKVSGTLQEAVNAGLVFGPQFMEIYNVDCAKASEQPALSSANVGMGL
jgi:hypothetical protein